MKKKTTKSKSKEDEAKKTVKKTTLAEKVSPMGKIKKSFNEGVAEGRRALLRKLLQAKGIETREIQKLYSTGMMEPEMLEDLTLSDLIKTSGISMGFARVIKEAVLRKGSDLPFEYEKNEIERIHRETEGIRAQTVEIRKEIEQLDKNHISLDAEKDEVLENRNKLEDELNKLKNMEKNCYFNEKRIQDELLFIVKEQNTFQEAVDRYKLNYGYSEKELNTIKREFLFTKGECNNILEKINFLVKKLDKTIKVKGAYQNKLASFLDELRRVHGTLLDASKKTSVEYYKNKPR